MIAAATLVFAVSSVFPVAYMADAAFSIDAFALDVRQRNLLANTSIVGTATAIFAAVLGIPLGFVLARMSFPLKMLLRLALIVPALLPPYVIALAWIYLVAPASSFNAMLPAPYSLTGVVIVLTIALYPLTMLATEIGLRRVEPRLEEAGLVHAAPPRVLWRITVPLIAPGIVAASLIVAVMAMSEFSVPGLLRVRVYTTEIFTAFAALYDVGRAVALAMPLLVTSIAVSILVVALAGTRTMVSRRAVGGAPALVLERWVPTAVAGAIVVALLTAALPIAALGGEAVLVSSIGSMMAGAGQAVANSLIWPAIGATAVTVVGLCLGYARARMIGRIGPAVDVLWLALFTVPSTIVGIGLIGVWNRPGAGTIYGTNTMLAVGYLARFLPVAALTMAAAIRSVPASHEEAAAIAGTGWLRCLFRIVIPQIGVALLIVWSITFVLAFGEVGTSILVAPPGESTLPIRVYTLTANAPPGLVAALALFQSAVILLPLAILGGLIAIRERR